jgi:hypothetical protein
MILICASVFEKWSFDSTGTLNQIGPVWVLILLRLLKSFSLVLRDVENAELLGQGNFVK